ncbi:HlyD family efflux transporter periplasmic adaptor subunit [Pseudoduganella violacea]|uniref:Putative peptide zinc metalloprotease protein n=1 Tax=Pseudoduganella violacea TaxID=1715466 RepID=A0A7W5B6V6_9BURK|nr:HlyD family efflux transporter periplasmic adaptor subunit [Pseudoduganella violacea]MBB3117616.1 putative peptide zinc metalloprotease protein [Pseudoduganella violacea]
MRRADGQGGRGGAGADAAAAGAPAGTGPGAADYALPPLRQELSLHAGPVQADGAPSWTLHDPSSNRFYQLGWASFEILQRWQLGSAERLLAALRAETTLQLGRDEVAAMLAFLSRHQLLVAATAEQSARLWQARQASRPSRAMWLLKNYLFFRVPLLRPEALLLRLLPYCAWLFHPRFWWAAGGALLLALGLLARRWDEFTHTFSGYGGWTAALGIGAALSLAKVLHELGHALTARRFGCRVPAMGVAFLVMMPVLYTDTNEAWKLRSRRQRLLIGGAGMLAELLLAVAATLLWCVLPDGPLRAGAFLLASTTWLATLAVNASPFMRFDGYFLLADYVGLPNLHQRAFAQALWRLRQWLLGLDDPAPEHFPAATRRKLIVFAWATWLYRLVLFLSIALLVYHLFFKALGLFLLFVELGWFIVRPIAGELGLWWQRRAELRWCRASRRSAVLLGLLVAGLVLPWQAEVGAPAVLGARQSQGLYAPAAAEVAAVAVRPGQLVQAGQVLAHLRSPLLHMQLAQAEARERQLGWLAAQQAFHSELQQQGAVLRRQWAAAQEQVASLRQQQARLRVRAPFAGRVADVSEALRPGTVIAEGEHLLDVLGPRGARGEAFVGEAQLAELQAGAPARFVADGGEHWAVQCRVGAIDDLNLPLLDQPLLASTHGGPIPVEARERGLVPLAAVFRVRLDECASGAAPLREMAGVARLQGERHSLLGRGWRALLALLRREGGL